MACCLMAGAAAVAIAVQKPCKAAPKPATPKARVLTDADNGKALTLRQGESLTLRLTENVATGYSWAIIASPKMPLTPISDRYIAPKHVPGMVGAAGTHEFRFKAAKSAKAFKLRLIYSRPWIEDKTGATEWKASISVVAKAKPAARAHAGK